MPGVAPDTETLPRRLRPGFSLVLSLVVMSVVLMTVITVASFVTIESRLSAQHQNFQRARLNATVSLRLALAHPWPPSTQGPRPEARCIQATCLYRFRS